MPQPNHELTSPANLFSRILSARSCASLALQTLRARFFRACASVVRDAIILTPGPVLLDPTDLKPVLLRTLIILGPAPVLLTSVLLTSVPQNLRDRE